jgi:hypothetical protein
MSKHTTKNQTANGSKRRASASFQKELSNAELDRVSGGTSSSYNESQTLVSSIMKQKHDSDNALIQKI